MKTLNRVNFAFVSFSAITSLDGLVVKKGTPISSGCFLNWMPDQVRHDKEWCDESHPTTAMTPYEIEG